jgi:hypothetical protein
MSFIPRGQSGEVTFGIKGSEETPSQVGKLTMIVIAPDGTRLVDATVTPLGEGSPDGWKGQMNLGETQVETGGDRLLCTCDYVGPLPAVGQEWRWKVNIQVPVETMPPTWDSSTNGKAMMQAHAPDGSGYEWSKQMSMGVRTTTAS